VPPSRKTAQVPGQRKQLQSGSAAGPAVAQQQAEPLTQIRHLHARGHMEVRVCSSGDFTGSLILWVIPQNWEGALSERH
jgi:tRNA A37 threonylcarbamoyltransferase TsaD